MTYSVASSADGSSSESVSSWQTPPTWTRPCSTIRCPHWGSPGSSCSRRAADAHARPSISSAGSSASTGWLDDVVATGIDGIATADDPAVLGRILEVVGTHALRAVMPDKTAPGVAPIAHGRASVSKVRSPDQGVALLGQERLVLEPEALS